MSLATVETLQCECVCVCVCVCVCWGVGIIKPCLIQNLCFRFGFGLDLCVCARVCVAKAEILLGNGAQTESRRVREPGRTALLHGPQSRVLW